MLRNILRETVFMRLCIVFSLGIISYEYTYQYLHLKLVFIVLLSLLTLGLLYYRNINLYNYTYTKRNGSLVFSIILLFAYLLCYVQDSRNNIDYLAVQHINEYELIISDAGKLKKNRCTHEATIIVNNNIISKVLLTINSKQGVYSIGDTLVLKAILLAIDTKKHPSAFDYKEYLSKKRIHHQFIIDSTAIIAYKKNTQFNVWQFTHALKARLINTLRSNINDEESFEMATALLLGERADIDADVMANYSKTGTIHIISVSGLHVGIIYIVLLKLINILPLLKKLFIKTSLIITLIWIYACLTGLPASVIRSALMISFLCIGKAINNRTNPMNHIAASALFILTYNTNYLFDVGFQLSYLAVIGIVYLQKPIYNLYLPKTVVDKYIWLTFSVSIAAQLFTLPLCIYYFHQFPNYFLIANLLAIPLSSIALYAAISNLIFANIPYLNKLCEWVITYSIQYLNRYLEHIANLPGAVTEIELWTMFECICFACTLMCLLLLLKEKLKVFLGYSLFCMLVLSLYEIYIFNKHNHAHLWIIHNPPYQNTMSIELSKSILHFIPKSKNTKLEEKILKNWAAVKKKKQHTIHLKESSYSIFIKNKIYKNTDTAINAQTPHYERICM